MGMSFKLCTMNALFNTFIIIIIFSYRNGVIHMKKLNKSKYNSNLFNKDKLLNISTLSLTVVITAGFFYTTNGSNFVKADSVNSSQLNSFEQHESLSDDENLKVNSGAPTSTVDDSKANISSISDTSSYTEIDSSSVSKATNSFAVVNNGSESYTSSTSVANSVSENDNSLTNSSSASFNNPTVNNDSKINSSMPSVVASSSVINNNGKSNTLEYQNNLQDNKGKDYQALNNLIVNLKAFANNKNNIISSNFMSQKIAIDGQEYSYSDLVNDGIIKKSNISWSYPYTTGDMNYIPTGTVDLLKYNSDNNNNEDDKTASKISFIISKNDILKPNDIIFIPLKTDINDNQPGPYYMSVNNWNPLIKDDQGQELSNNMTYRNGSGFYIPISSLYDGSIDHTVSIDFNTSGGQIFPKTASNGKDLSFTETVGNEVRTYNWKPTPTTAPNDSDTSEKVGKMWSGIPLVAIDDKGLDLRIVIKGEDDKALIGPVSLNDGKDYIQQIIVSADKNNIGSLQNADVNFNTDDFWKAVAVPSELGPATNNPGWAKITNGVANSWGNTSNSLNIQRPVFSKVDGIPKENQYSVSSLGNNKMLLQINYGKSQYAKIPEQDFVNLAHSQYASMSDDVLNKMKSIYSDGEGNIYIPYTIRTSIPFINKNDQDSQVRYTFDVSDNRGIYYKNSAVTDPKNSNGYGSQKKISVQYLDENNNVVAPGYDEYGFPDTDVYEAKSLNINGYILDDTKLPSNAIKSTDGTYDVKDKFPNQNQNIIYYYSKNKANARVQYIDVDNGNLVLQSDLLTGKNEEKSNYSTKDNINKFNNNGYTLVSDDFSSQYPSGYVLNDSVNPTFLVKLKHTHKLVDNSKDITRTINYLDSNSRDIVLHAPNIQTVKYNSYAVYDVVTDALLGYITSSNDDPYGHMNPIPQWSSADNTWSEVKSTLMPGKVADKLTIPSQLVSFSDADADVDVLYSPTPVNPGGSTTPVNPGGGITPVNPGGSTTPVNPGGGTTPVNPGGGITPVNPGKIKFIKTDLNNKKKLPQTGEVTSIWYLLLGLILSLLSIFGLKNKHLKK